MKTVTIENEKCILHGRNIIVKRGTCYFEYNTYEEVKEDDYNKGNNRIMNGHWIYYSHSLSVLLGNEEQ